MADRTIDSNPIREPRIQRSRRSQTARREAVK